MKNDVIYLLVVVAIGWVVTFGLRALPFLLFAGKSRELPPWVEKLGNIVSPVIIAGLIVYSYATLKIGEGDAAVLAWKTVLPYLAGGLTIGLQLWRRNPLMSIVAGTVVYMCLISCGCASRPPLNLDAREPSIRLTSGGFRLDGQPLEAVEIPALLDDYEVPKDRVIYIGVDDDVSDLMIARKVIYALGIAGWKSSVLVTRRHSGVENLGKPKRPSAVSGADAAVAPSAPKKIRYRKATE